MEDILEEIKLKPLPLSYYKIISQITTGKEKDAKSISVRAKKYK